MFEAKGLKWKSKWEVKLKVRSEKKIGSVIKSWK